MSSIERIAIIGGGTMGRGIAQVAAAAGFQTCLFDLEVAILDQALQQIDRNLRKAEELGKITAAMRASTREHLRSTTDFADAVKECDFVIEAVPERIELKLEIFQQAEENVRPDVVLATNTSSLSITEIASAVAHPSRVIGMHFFNPVHLMRLVEIVRGLETSSQTVQTTTEVAQRMGKEVVDTRESPGFITSRINALIGNEAFYMLQEGVASAGDIDKAIKLGLNHPMGPFEMVDLVGLDTRLSILQFLHRSLGEKYRPAPLLVQYVKAGRLGRKSGKGVYEY